MFLAITSTTWLMTGMGIGVVFVILILLVFVLQVFSYVAAKSAQPQPAVAKKKDDGPVMTIAQASDTEKVAIATALHLYYNDAHDHESGVLTIHMDPHTLWHEELNPHLV